MRSCPQLSTTDIYSGPIQLKYENLLVPFLLLIALACIAVIFVRGCNDTANAQTTVVFEDAEQLPDGRIAIPYDTFKLMVERQDTWERGKKKMRYNLNQAHWSLHRARQALRDLNTELE